MAKADVSEVASGVFCARGTDVNWILLRDGTDLTLIDAGYPGDTGAVEESIRDIGGRPEDVRAILVTHAHVDHIGAVNHFHSTYGTPVYLSDTETKHAHGEFHEGATELDVIKRLWRPGMLPWSLRILRGGASKKPVLGHAQPFPTSGALDLPGAPTPVATPGHTSGHTAYFLPAVGVVATGDALVTGHALTKINGPHLLPGFFNHDEAETRSALDVIATLDAGSLIPGHGAPHVGPIREAVEAAKAR
ncbi:MBL fold metallo-hydrolase [Antrihabitans stalactiti]|uniref:MBL fold metallo-hydrolase n=1 Tax=Antrihabitans stalactiti TaxID=2584121 RepID=A0A848KGM1_9NOCA|nr:MBL fold metallo-hydrolase [Antrihabitans stalactiti]NMN97321.1 MBL fold metallo-hydrolase [Antrihabitans stalactiti]